MTNLVRALMTLFRLTLTFGTSMPRADPAGDYTWASDWRTVSGRGVLRYWTKKPSRLSAALSPTRVTAAWMLP
jgi:hypothetical protein